jgi:peroxiredoxin
MKRMKRTKLYILNIGLLVSIGLLTLAAISAAAQPETTADAEMKKVKALIQQARKEAEQFKEAGGRNTNKNYPGRRWAAALWQYREANKGAEAAGRATAMALYFLIDSDLLDEMMAKVDTLSADDTAWKYSFFALQELARRTKDDGYLFGKTEFLIKNSADKDIRANAYLAQGDAYQERGELDRARQALQAAVDERPGADLTEAAQGKLYEITYLKVGQNAPQFTAKTMDGASVSLADYRGKVVLLDFWAADCSVCVKEIPLLKEAYLKYKDKGMVIIGVSLDESLPPLQKMIELKGITWTQLFDGKGYDGALRKLFNVQGAPNYFILDREGRIAAKNVNGQKLNDALDELMKKSGL